MTLAGAIEIVTVNLYKSAAAFLATPLGWFTIALTAAAAAAYLFYKRLNSVAEAA